MTQYFSLMFNVFFNQPTDEIISYLTLDETEFVYFLNNNSSELIKICIIALLKKIFFKLKRL